MRNDFTPPGYESRLRALTAVIRFGPEALPGALFLVFLFHVERTLTYAKQSDAVGLKQMQYGIRQRQGGRLRGGCGLGKSQIATANLELEKRGLIARTRRYDASGRNDRTEYRICWEAVRELLARVAAENGRGRKADKQTVRKSDGPNMRKPAEPCLRQSDDDGVSTSSSDEKIRTERTVFQNPNETALDEGGKGTPQEEFENRLIERHRDLIERGEFDPRQCIGDVCWELPAGSITLKFLELDAKYTRGHVYNPGGYYRDLARKHNALLDAERRAAEEAEKAAECERKKAAEASKCPHCGCPKGRGLLYDGDHMIPCPVCYPGMTIEDVRADDRRRAQERRQRVSEETRQSTGPDRTG